MSRGSGGAAGPRVDLHLHTTASDGRYPPAEVVSLAAAAGLTIIAITDHDTVAAVRAAQARAAPLRLEVLPGIEVTAVEDGRDVHVLGYFIEPEHGELAQFLVAQRADRVVRAEAIGRRLARLGLHVDLDVVLAAARTGGQSIGRPQIARAMVAAGHARDVTDAFDRWLGRDRPAFVERTGRSPEAVIDMIHRAGGLASLAHPGRTGIDARIVDLCAAGLDALEVYHSDHDAAAVDRYARMAAELRVLSTGGSDFHGDPVRDGMPGTAMLPPPQWEALQAARTRHGWR